MSKFRLVAVFFILISILVVAVPILAGPSDNAEGLWQYTPFPQEVNMRGCNTFIISFEESIWSGTFIGTSTEDGRIRIHCSGRWSFRGTVYFDDVTVEGRSGTFQMHVVGSIPDVNTEWTGSWVITSGTGDLENLRGQGSWWG